MSYFAYILALIGLLLKDTKGWPMEKGVSEILNSAASINGTLFWISLVIWVIFLIIAGVTLLLGHRDEILGLGCFCGCGLIFLALLPIWQFLMWRVSLAMAGAYGPSGATDPVKFWAMVALMLFFGVG